MDVDKPDEEVCSDKNDKNSPCGFPEEREKMVETLKKMQQVDGDGYLVLDSDDDEDEAGLSDRLQGLDLDSDAEKIWEQLTKSEKAEFQKMIDIRWSIWWPD